MLIRVGLDEWFAVEGVNPQSESPDHLVGLNTAGLSGCVAIGLCWGDVVSLAHVYSDCTEQTWLSNRGAPGYLQTLTAAYEACQRLRPRVSEPDGLVVYSEGTPAWLPRQLKQWLRARGVDYQEGLSPTCRVWVRGGQLYWASQLAEDPADVNNYTTSQNAAAPILVYQALSAKAAAASPPQGESD